MSKAKINFIDLLEEGGHPVLFPLVAGAQLSRHDLRWLIATANSMVVATQNSYPATPGEGFTSDGDRPFECFPHGTFFTVVEAMKEHTATGPARYSFNTVYTREAHGGEAFTEVSTRRVLYPGIYPSSFMPSESWVSYSGGGSLRTKAPIFQIPASLGTIQRAHSLSAVDVPLGNTVPSVGHQYSTVSVPNLVSAVGAALSVQEKIEKLVGAVDMALAGLASEVRESATRINSASSAVATLEGNSTKLSTSFQQAMASIDAALDLESHQGTILKEIGGIQDYVKRAKVTKGVSQNYGATTADNLNQWAEVFPMGVSFAMVSSTNGANAVYPKLMLESPELFMENGYCTMLDLRSALNGEKHEGTDEEKAKAYLKAAPPFFLYNPGNVGTPMLSMLSVALLRSAWPDVPLSALPFANYRAYENGIAYSSDYNYNWKGMGSGASRINAAQAYYAAVLRELAFRGSHPAPIAATSEWCGPDNFLPHKLPGVYHSVLLAPKSQFAPPEVEDDYKRALDLIYALAYRVPVAIPDCVLTAFSSAEKIESVRKVMKTAYSIDASKWLFPAMTFERGQKPMTLAFPKAGNSATGIDPRTAATFMESLLMGFPELSEQAKEGKLT